VGQLRIPSLYNQLELYQETISTATERNRDFFGGMRSWSYVLGQYKNYFLSQRFFHWKINSYGTRLNIRRLPLYHIWIFIKINSESFCSSLYQIHTVNLVKTSTTLLLTVQLSMAHSVRKNIGTACLISHYLLQNEVSLMG